MSTNPAHTVPSVIVICVHQSFTHQCNRHTQSTLSSPHSVTTVIVILSHLCHRHTQSPVLSSHSVTIVIVTPSHHCHCHTQSPLSSSPPSRHNQSPLSLHTQSPLSSSNAVTTVIVTRNHHSHRHTQTPQSSSHLDTSVIVTPRTSVMPIGLRRDTEISCNAKRSAHV